MLQFNNHQVSESKTISVIEEEINKHLIVLDAYKILGNEIEYLMLDLRITNTKLLLRFLKTDLAQA